MKELVSEAATLWKRIVALRRRFKNRLIRPDLTSDWTQIEAAELARSEERLEDIFELLLTEETKEKELRLKVYEEELNGFRFGDICDENHNLMFQNIMPSHEIPREKQLEISRMMVGLWNAYHVV